MEHESEAAKMSGLNDELYIVKLQDGVWLAPWKGDPGRTLKMASAKKFTSLASAHRAIAKALQFRSFKNPTVEAYNAELSRRVAVGSNAGLCFLVGPVMSR